jgi:hypothetical protein
MKYFFKGLWYLITRPLRFIRIWRKTYRDLKATHA